MNAKFADWLICKSPKVVFQKTTYQKTWIDEFIEMNNSLYVHSQKHPDVLSVLGYKPLDLAGMTPQKLAREYFKATKEILKSAKGLKTEAGRGIDRRNLVINHKGYEWFIVLEQTHRNLGLKKMDNPLLVPVGPLKIVTCYRKSKGEKYSFNSEWLLSQEFDRLSNILYTGSYFDLKNRYDEWVSYIDFIIQMYILDFTNIFDKTIKRHFNTLEKLWDSKFKILINDYQEFYLHSNYFIDE